MRSHGFLQALGATFRLFRVLGFEVRAHWTLPVFVLYILVIYTKYFGSPDGLILGLTFALLLYSMVLIHELGHSLAARRLRIAEIPIFLSPIGGLAGVGGRMRDPREELIVTFWGPVVHPIMLILGAPLYFLIFKGPLDLGFYPNHVVGQFFYINLAMLLFNLIPAFPMDGGRFLRAFLAMKMYAAKATLIAAYIGQVISIVFIVLSVQYGGDFWFLLTIIGISNIITCERVKEECRHVDPYESEERYDLSNYYRGDDDDDRLPWERAQEQKKPGVFQRWREARARKRDEAERDRDQQIRAHVDRLLDKVAKHGMPSLTLKEREFLNRASDTFRKK